MTPRRERARLLLRSGSPRYFGYLVRRNKIANLAQDAELGAGWGYFEFFHPCRVAEAHKKFQPIFSYPVGWLWIQTFGSYVNDARFCNMAVVNPDEIFVAGQFSGFAPFGSFALNSSSADIFVGRIDTPPPRLSIALASDGITITAPEWAVGFSLQSSTNIEVPMWSETGDIPLLSNSQLIYTNLTTNFLKFFRLNKP